LVNDQRKKESPIVSLKRGREQKKSGIGSVKTRVQNLWPGSEKRNLRRSVASNQGATRVRRKGKGTPNASLKDTKNHTELTI